MSENDASDKDTTTIADNSAVTEDKPKDGQSTKGYRYNIFYFVSKFISIMFVCTHS